MGKRKSKGRGPLFIIALIMIAIGTGLAGFWFLALYWGQAAFRFAPPNTWIRVLFENPQFQLGVVLVGVGLLLLLIRHWRHR